MVTPLFLHAAAYRQEQGAIYCQQLSAASVPLHKQHSLFMHVSGSAHCSAKKLAGVAETGAVLSRWTGVRCGAVTEQLPARLGGVPCCWGPKSRWDIAPSSMSGTIVAEETSPFAAANCTWEQAESQALVTAHVV